MIGVDAAEISYIREHLADLPNFRTALEGSQTIQLYSQFEAFPGSVWPSFFTEKPVGEHGFYLIHGWDPATMRYRRVAREWWPFEPFWRELARRDVKVIAVDVPMTQVAAGAPSLEIAGWGTHQTLTDCSVNSPSLASELARLFGTNSMGSDVPLRRNKAERNNVRDRLIWSAGRKAELAEWLVATQKWELLLVVFGELHRGGHVLWPTAGLLDATWLLEVYRAVDRALGRILTALQRKKAPAAIFALHGMGHNHSQNHFTSAIMDRLVGNRTPAARPFPSTRTSSGNPLRACRRQLQQQIAGVVTRSLSTRVRDRLVNYYYVGRRDWHRTPAFALKSDLNGYIRLNRSGRERDGILPLNGLSTTACIARIREGFASFRQESGAPLVSQISVTDEIAQGQMRQFLPDLIVRWDETSRPAQRVVSSLYGELAAQPDGWRLGHHRGHGFLVIPEGLQRVSNPPPKLSVEEIPSFVRAWLAVA